MHFSEKQQHFMFHGKQESNMDERQKEMERSISEAMNDEPHPQAKIECRKRVFLFNCDKTYSLDSVGKLLLDTKGDIRQELSFDIVKTYFRLSEMSHVAEKAIPKLQMDVAFFVVHANESRISINEENAGIGYAKVYKALLQATEGKVLIVIGGDDHYKNKGEEESSVISRWAMGKVSSQFKEGFLNGKKSFIFSWNKTHRKIHEEALLHYFDPNKSGQKFEWKPIERPRVPQETLPKTPETEKLEAKERKQFTDRPHAMDGAHSSSENEVSQQESSSEAVSVSKAMFHDKGDKLKEQRKKDTECEDLGDNGNGPSEDCTGTIALFTSHLRDIGTINTDDYVIVNKEDLNEFPEEQQMGSKTKDGTLVMKTIFRNGSISYEDKEMVKYDPQWIPPGDFMTIISAQLGNVAQAEVEFYQIKETGALRIIVREVSNLSVIYAIIEYFYHMLTGLIDIVYNLSPFTVA